VTRANLNAAAFTSWASIGRYFADLEGTSMVGSFGKTLTVGYSALVHTPDVARAYADGSLSRGLGEADYRSDAATSRLVDAYLGAQMPDFMFVSLGDTDEHAHAGDYAGYDAALRFADRALGAWIEAYRSRREEVLVVVTTDHGRASNFRDHGAKHPESRFTWAVVSDSKNTVVKQATFGVGYQLAKSVRDMLHLRRDLPNQRALTGAFATVTP
jgi:predicted AlkP superfamily pyrophosphatase or phosphodiesterase